MANFGKKAKLDCQRPTTKVECLVSVHDEILGDDGKPVRYRVVVQRLQDGVPVEDAWMADAMPWIVNRKQFVTDQDGNTKVQYSHDDYVTAEMMEAIRSAALNCYETETEIEEAPGVVTKKSVQNYCVRLDIGFNLAKGEAFFYRIKSGVNKDSLAKDIKYNLRHMPASGRALTKEILEGHREVTDIAARVYADSLKLGKGSADENADGKEDGT